MIELKKYIQKVPKNVWILLTIVALGIFIRTYNFREWLYFYPDQARDVMITEDYLNGKTPLPVLGPIAASTRFKIGPVYYYFQIISGRIFGVRPETMAYPDLFFGILAIPLFYYFLKKYFSANLSLALTGLFSISFFAVKYSRFAWNSNPIPFFMLLFLLSLLEFLEKKEKTSWFWIIAAGISLGIGLQLHTILFVLLPLIAFLVFVYLMVKKPRIWKSGLVVLAVALFLNAGQLSSEIGNNFHNTRTLFKVSTNGSQNSQESLLDSLKSVNFCHIQANSYIVSSLGDKEDCTFSRFLAKELIIPSHDYTNWPLIGIYLSILFSIVGYVALIYLFFREKEPRRKHFLGLVLLVIVLSYIILFMVADSLLLRYFIHLFFVPFLFLGIFLEFARKYFRWGFYPAVFLVLGFFAFSNFSTIKSEAEAYFAKNRSDQQYVVLGEIEPMRDYMAANSGSSRDIYIYAEGKYIQNYFKPIYYLLNEKGFVLSRVKDPGSAPSGAPLFYLGASSDYLKGDSIKGMKITDYKYFGQIGVYKLEK